GFEYLPGQLPPSANRLPDGTRVAYTYEAALDNQVLSITPAGEPANTFTYHPRLGQPDTSSGPLGTLDLTYTPSGKPLEDTWTVEGNTHATTWRHSLNGLRQGLVDSHGSDHRYEYDRFGRLEKHLQDDVTTAFTFDTFSRVETVTTTDASNRLVQTLTYDGLGREHTRTFAATTAGSTRTCTQTLLYSDLDQVVSRAWEDGAIQGQETFDYDSLGRLTTYTADAAVAPQDPFGNRIIEQVFTFNALDGYTQVDSTFADGSTDKATFTYDNTQDPTQVTTIAHTHSSWPASITLDYDACGRVIADSLGRTLTWDAQDRLTRVQYNGQTCDYRYDPSGNLTDRVLDGTLTRSFFSAGLLTHEQTGDDLLQRIGENGALFALNRITAGVRRVTLLGCDAQGSVRLEADDAVRTRHYSAHGAEAEDPTNGPYGYAGERREPLTGWYIPGGYRPYDPIVMGFLSPDSESPFGRGGLNPYAYCGGDPVNRIDPDGHAWWTWLVAGIGTALGVVATVASFGAAAPAFAAIAAGGIGALTASGAASIAAATLGAISLGTGIASTVLEATGHDDKAASILGWVSLGTGLVGTALEIAPKALGTVANKLGRSAGKSLTKTSRQSRSVTLPRETVDQTKDVFFFPDYDGKKTPAVLTHGDRQGNLLAKDGRWLQGEMLAREFIEPELALFVGAGYTDSQSPLVLIACNAGNSGAAQQVSNVIKRPVLSPQGVLKVEDFPATAQRMLSGNGYGKILSRRSTIPGITRSHIASQSEYVDAVWGIYFPR
ncbi:hypothetical protein P0Y43_09970, partial [Pseudomonas entomophila]|uniref:RHS repeat-associated core domain-containing protein n=1 Tax=Pseudomonas entomophila TaxID=312306 RepID=UPI0023D7CE05